MLLEFRHGFSLQDAYVIPSHNNSSKAFKNFILQWFCEEFCQHFVSEAIIHCKGDIF